MVIFYKYTFKSEGSQIKSYEGSQNREGNGTERRNYRTKSHNVWRHLWNDSKCEGALYGRQSNFEGIITLSICHVVDKKKKKSTDGPLCVWGGGLEKTTKGYIAFLERI